MLLLCSLIGAFCLIAGCRPARAEEEDEADSHYYDSQIPDEEAELAAWWEEFRARADYPCYGIVLAARSDAEAVALAERHREELAWLSGDHCCFIFFRNLSAARNLEPFRFEEQEEWVYPLSRLLNLDMRELPCFLFFERIDSGDYLLFSLKGKSVPEIISLAREMFETACRQEPEETFAVLKRFKTARRLQTGSWVIGQNMLAIGKDVISAMLKSFATGRS
ncbi:MAG: hypothetical protein IT210_22050 [Armatimonadetes bacterium]|nr:hypothetical protein [Armatimonadota bacterium]